MVGLPGCGKSSYLERLRVQPISSDEIRKVLADDITAQSINWRVFATVRYLLRHRIATGRPVSYVDATHLNVRERAPYIALGRVYGCDVEAVYFDVPIAICMERNDRRGRIVPRDAIERMALKLVPPSLEEGFSKITIVRYDPAAEMEVWSELCSGRQLQP